MVEVSTVDAVVLSRPEARPALQAERVEHFDQVALLIQGDDNYGVGRVAREIAALVPGIRCVAFCQGREAQDIAATGVPVHVLPGGDYFRGFAPRRGVLSAAWQLLRAWPHWRRCACELHAWCEQYGVRVLHGNVWAHYFTLGALRRMHPGRYRVIWHTHNFLNLDRNLSLRGRFNCWQVRRGADWLLCVSHAVAEGWGRSGVPARVVHNCVSSRYLGLSPVAPFIAPTAARPLRLVGSGRMEWWKGHHVSIAALAHLQASGVPATLDIFGGPLNDNPYHDSLRAQVARLGLESRVRFHGYTDDFVHRLADYDVALQSRIDPEPCGLYVLECMNRELPIVASGGGGTPELVRDDHEGSLYPPGDAAAMARCIERLARDPARATRLARAGRARVRAEFSPERFARNLGAFYAEVLAASRAVSPIAPILTPVDDAFDGLKAG